MKNQFQLNSWIYRLACLEGLSADTVVSTVRREDLELYKKAGGNNIEAMANSFKKQHEDAIGPLAKRYQTQLYAEMGLRGDLQVELQQLTTENPHEVREVVELIKQLGARQEWGAAGVPADLDGAVGALEAAGVDPAVVEPYRTRMLALYPPVALDEESADAAPAVA